MFKGRPRPLMVLAVLVFFGCTSPPENVSPPHGEKAVDEAPVVTRAEVLKSLPCFGCHELEAFLGPKEPGVFSHSLHKRFDVHCNQCHDVRGHGSGPRINVQTCSACHGVESSTDKDDERGSEC